jgi:uncharacterized protein YdhG (YjbR/CyaY superfamily)
MCEIDAYLAGLDEPRKAALERIRDIVRRTVPDAQEAISYGMPAFRYKAAYLIGYCAHSKHLGLYPTAGPIEALRDELAGFTLSRGAIRFTTDHQIPEPLVERLVLARVAAIAGD